MKTQKSYAIKPFALSGAISYTCQFFNPDTQQFCSITETGMVTNDPNTKSVLTVTLDTNNPEYRHSWDPDNKVHNDKAEAQMKFWKDNPAVYVPGRKNANASKTNVFIFVNESESKGEQASIMNKRYDAMTKLRNMGEEGVKRVAYYYGLPNVAQKDPLDLLIALADFKDGLIMNTANLMPGTRGTEKEKTILDHFMEDFSTKEEAVDISVNVRKAIELGIIEVRGSGAGKSYTVNNVPVGTNEEQVCAYLLNNIDMYNQYVKRTLKNKAEADALNADPSADKFSSMSMDELQKIAKGLSIKNYWSIKQDKLLLLIRAAEGQHAPA